jgi:hypothetical protein
MLPPGTLRRLRIKWFALGVLLGAALVASAAMYVAAIVPPELAYRSAKPTVRPEASPAPRHPAAPAIPSCQGQGKDCAALDAPGADPPRPLPEPGALALVALGLGALALYRSHT